MNTNAPVSAPKANKMPDADAIWKQWRNTRRWFAVVVTLAVVLAAALIVWVFWFAKIDKATVATLGAAANLTVVLAPVLAAAAGVERTLETIFNVIENSWKSLVAYLGRGLRWLNAAQVEVGESRQWLADVSTRYNEEMSSLRIKEGESVAELSKAMQDKISAAKAMMDLAEKRLADAEDNLAGVTSSDGYRSAKAAASIVLGLFLGIIVAAMGQLQMFAMLGIGSVPERVDVFITGLVIGSGSYPVHSLVGILQQTKDTLDSAKGYLNRSGGIKQAVVEKITSIAQGSPESNPAG